MNPIIGANFTAILSASTTVTFPPALCMCLDPTGEFYVVATSAAIAASPSLRASGLAVSQGGPQTPITIQYVGEVAEPVTGLGTAGAPTYVRVSSSGVLERIASISSGDQVVGWADIYGNVQISFGAQASSVIGTLAGDVTGPASVTVVERIHGATVPIAGSLTIGNSLHVTGTSALGYGPLALNGGSNYVTGTLPVANLPSLAGDATGAITSNTVAKINGATVPVAGSLTVGNALQVSGSSALTYGPINLAGGSNYVTGTIPSGNLPDLAGDVTGPPASNSVVRLTGTSGTGRIANNGAYLDFGAGLSTTLGVLRFTNSASSTVKAILSITSQDGGNPTRTLLSISGASSLDTFAIGESSLDALTITNKSVSVSFVGTSSTFEGLLVQPAGGLRSSFLGATNGGGLTGLWLGANTSTPTNSNYTIAYDNTTLKIRNVSNTITVTAADIDFFLDNLSFGAGQTPLIGQDAVNSGSAAANFTIRSQGNIGAGAGGNLILEGSSAPSGTRGRIRLNLYTGVSLIELVPNASATSVLALVRGTAITSELASTSGDRTIFIANAAAAPTVNASGGGLLYSASSTLTWWGGALNLNGTTTLHTYVGGISSVRSGIWFGDAADAPTTGNYTILSDNDTLLQVNAGDELVLTAASDIVLTTPTVVFIGSQATPSITQATVAGAATTLTVRAQGSSTVAGGSLLLEGGQRTGSTAQGGARLGFYNGGVMVEAKDLYDSGSKRVTALVRGTTVTSTEMPSGSGDLVIYIGNAATVPSANPTSGGILYSDGGALTWRSPNGVVTTLAPV